MPATSEARIAANRANCLKSTGPSTPGGREQYRRNALKHGLTGAGVVLPNEDAAEVERRFAAFQDELQPSGEVGRALVRRAALCSVRMERGVSQETAALSERVRQAEADFVAPEGADAETVARLRAEAAARAMFDPSKEASLARKYEASAERGFFRALKELRQLEKQAKAIDPAAELEASRRELASFLSDAKMGEEFDAMYEAAVAKDPGLADPWPARLSQTAPSTRIPAAGGSFELPFAIGRPR